MPPDTLLESYYILGGGVKRERVSNSSGGIKRERTSNSGGNA